MRESISEHKEAPAYLAVMSADSHEEDSSPVHQRHDHQPPPPSSLGTPGGAGSKTTAHSSNGPGVEVGQREEGTPELPAQSSSLQDSLKVSTDDANDKSAFRITEVVSAFGAGDDLDQTKGHEADSFMEDGKQRGQSESSETDEFLKISLLVTTDIPLPVKEQELEVTNERVVPLEGGVSNGPVTQPAVRRFRRVNKYERGRWVVEDTLEHREAEERPESEMRGGTQIGGSGAVGRESPFSQRRKGGGREGVGEEQLHSRSSSNIAGQGIDLGEKGDHYHADRTGSVAGGFSVGGENLSHNTSMSSLTTAGDKSVDGDHSGDQLRNESESEATCLLPQASTGYSTPAQSVSSPPQHPRHMVASFPPSSATSVTTTAHTVSDSGDEENQSELVTKTGVHRVEKALSHLNKELQQLVEENKEITRLKDLNRTLEEKNFKLEQEVRGLEDDKRELVACNTDLTGRITNLQHRLDELTQRNSLLHTENESLVLEKQQLAEKGEQLTSRLQSLSGESTSSHS